MCKKLLSLYCPVKGTSSISTFFQKELSPVALEWPGLLKQDYEANYFRNNIIFNVLVFYYHGNLPRF